jgi:predicted DNA-binding transcriptional regulator AlpA
MPNKDDLLTTSQVAELTGWSVTSINRWAQKGDLPPERKLPGRTGSYLFRTSVVQERLRTRTEAGALITAESAA